VIIHANLWTPKCASMAWLHLFSSFYVYLFLQDDTYGCTEISKLRTLLPLQTSVWSHESRCNIKTSRVQKVSTPNRRKGWIKEDKLSYYYYIFGL
jgi:hypothetical protein